MRNSVALLVLGSAVLAPAAVRAHHAFDAEFDRNKPIEVQGKIVKVDWTNPHCWIYVAVTKPDGTVETWGFEGAGVAALVRRGFTKDFTKWGEGVDVFASGYMSRGVPFRASGRVLRYPNGKILFVSSTGDGGPDSNVK